MAQWTSSSLAGGAFTRFSSKSSGRFESYTESAPVAQSAEHRSYEPKVTVSCCLQVFCSFITSLGFDPSFERLSYGVMVAQRTLNLQIRVRFAVGEYLCPRGFTRFDSVQRFYNK